VQAVRDRDTTPSIDCEHGDVRPVSEHLDDDWCSPPRARTVGPTRGDIIVPLHRGQEPWTAGPAALAGTKRPVVWRKQLTWGVEYSPVRGGDDQVRPRAFPVLCNLDAVNGVHLRTRSEPRVSPRRRHPTIRAHTERRSRIGRAEAEGVLRTAELVVELLPRHRIKIGQCGPTESGLAAAS